MVGLPVLLGAARVWGLNPVCYGEEKESKTKPPRKNEELPALNLWLTVAVTRVVAKSQC